MNIIDFEMLKDMGFVPGIIIIGGWAYAVILLFICLYYLILYISKSSTN